MVKFDKSLEEVWKWKKNAYHQTKQFNIRQLVSHIHKEVSRAKKSRISKKA